MILLVVWVIKNTGKVFNRRIFVALAVFVTFGCLSIIWLSIHFTQYAKSALFPVLTTALAVLYYMFYCEEFKKKNPGKRLPAKMPTTLHDGDGLKENGDEYGPECAGCMVMSTNSKRKPVVVYADKTPLTDEQEIYSGCYGRAVLNFYVYEHTGKIGVSAGLNGVMKVSDGEPLAGGIVTDADWDIDDEEYGADLL